MCVCCVGFGILQRKCHYNGGLVLNWPMSWPVAFHSGTALVLVVYHKCLMPPVCVFHMAVQLLM